jgi:hypothetical protein
MGTSKAIQEGWVALGKDADINPGKLGVRLQIDPPGVLETPSNSTRIYEPPFLGVRLALRNSCISTGESVNLIVPPLAAFDPTGPYQLQGLIHGLSVHMLMIGLPISITV